MQTTRKTRKKTAFVPRIIFQAATAAAVVVVPVCATGCGGISLGPIPDAGADILATVACISCGVADVGFDGGDGGSDVVFTVAACGFDGEVCGVAACGFDGSPCEPLDAGVADVGFTDGGVADVGFTDGPFGVAIDAFGGDTGEG
jgi:hypothetical protein